MDVRIIDPPAYTPPYDRALCAALARAGMEVELVTSPFGHGPVPEPRGYRVAELFYRSTRRLRAGGALARAAKLAAHVPGMAKLRRRVRDADVAHFQWLTLPELDAPLLPRPRANGPALVWTVHDPPPEGGARLRGWRRAARRFDALVAHSKPGAELLADRLAVPRERIHVIRHGAFTHLTAQPSELPLPAELADAEGPVVLCFGLIRPYKGIDVLLEAFRSVTGAELWIVGRPMMDLGPLRALAERCAATVRFVPRFVTDPELPAFFRRADLVVLPYREADQSGVLYTALAFGKPTVATAVGGFPEVAAAGGAIRIVPPGDPVALGAAIGDLIADRAERERLGEAARAAAEGPYSWDRAAAETLALYRSLRGSPR